MYLFRDSLPSIFSKIRFLHAYPKAPAVDVYINDSLVSSNLSFSNITKYSNSPIGKVRLSIYPFGTRDKALYSTNLDLAPSSFYTISLVQRNNSLYSIILKDSNSPNSLTNSSLRFMNFSPNLPLLDLSLPTDTILFNDVEYLEVTGYYTLSPGIYNLKVSFSVAEVINKYLKNLQFKNGVYYTIYIIGLLNDKPQAGYLLVNDGEDFM